MRGRARRRLAARRINGSDKEQVGMDRCRARAEQTASLSL
jgi:hypothetical protein